jgi:hypothetical protein
MLAGDSGLCLYSTTGSCGTIKYVKQHPLSLTAKEKYVYSHHEDV